MNQTNRSWYLLDIRQKKGNGMYTDNNHLTNKEDVFHNKELLDAIKQLKDGNEQGFAVIYNQTYRYVYSRAKTMFSDEQQVQDLVQEVYVAVYRNINSLKSDESLFAWLRTITFQQGAKLMRKERKELLLSEDNEELFDSILDEDAEVENGLVDKQDIEIIRDCINRLSSEHKSVILAYYYDNLKVEDIAELLEISVGTVKSRLHSARKKLKTYIEEQEKKQGYKLHSFGGITFVLVMRSMLQENMNVSTETMDISFSAICKELGIKGIPLVNGSVVSGTEGKTMKSFFSKLAELGTKKAIAVVVGTVAVTGTVGTGAVLINENILFHTHEYVEEITAEPTCEVDGIKTFSCECGDSYTESISAVGHSYGDYVYNDDATTEADGTETAICICGATDTKVVVGTKVEEAKKEETEKEETKIEEKEEVVKEETKVEEPVVKDEPVVVETPTVVVHQLDPDQIAIINAGLYNVTALPSGGYGVLTKLTDDPMMGDQLIANYVAGLGAGLEPTPMYGGGIDGYDSPECELGFRGTYCDGVQQAYDPYNPEHAFGF